MLLLGGAANLLRISYLPQIACINHLEQTPLNWSWCSGFPTFSSRFPSTFPRHYASWMFPVCSMERLKGAHTDDNGLMGEIAVRSEQRSVHETRTVLLDRAVAAVNVSEDVKLRPDSLDRLQELGAPSMVIGPGNAIQNPVRRPVSDEDVRIVGNCCV